MKNLSEMTESFSQTSEKHSKIFEAELKKDYQKLRNVIRLESKSVESFYKNATLNLKRKTGVWIISGSILLIVALIIGSLTTALLLKNRWTIIHVDSPMTMVKTRTSQYDGSQWIQCQRHVLNKEINWCQLKEG